MKRRIFAFILTLALTMSLAVGASATEYSSPVTLTVVNTERPINVTVPAALPVSVVNGYVVTATNAAIRNNAGSGSVRVTKITIMDGAMTVGNYNNFGKVKGTIALSLNGCPTTGAGALSITQRAFPAISAGESMPLLYQAKVCVEGEVSGITAATVVFTISAE